MQGFKCVDCGKLPPDSESAYTLIGGKSGWRLTRHKGVDGVVVSDWRCPDCWTTFRKAQANASKAAGPTGGPPPMGTKGSSGRGER